MHGHVADFNIRGSLTRILAPFRAQGSALTRDVSSFREQYCTGMRRYYWAGKIAGPDPRKLYIYIYIYERVMVFN